MSIRRFRTSSQLEFNLKQYLDREFVNQGFYFNIPSGHVAVNGERGDILQRVNSNVYESFADDWVADTDAVGIAGFEPILASGVFVDGVFHPRGSAPFMPVVDYANGRIIFEGSGISNVSSVVSTEFSYKEVIVDVAGSNRITQLFSFIRDNVPFTPNAFPSGNQRQTPAVVIDLQNTIMSPSELGGGKNRNQLVTFHVVTNDRNKLNSITDFIVAEQFRKTVKGVDFNLAPQQFLKSGDRAPSYKNFTELQASGAIAWQRIYIDEGRVRERVFIYDLHRTRVDMTMNLLFLPPEGG